MGRPRGSTKKSDTAAASNTETKSKSLDKPTRATREKPRKSYREVDGSDEEVVFDEEVKAPSSPEEIPEPSDSDEDFDEGDSSGSEYGKKKKAVKSGRGAKGRVASPAKKGKGKGRGRPPASASKAKSGGRKTASPVAKGGAKRGRKPAAAAAKSTSNGSKKKRAADSSDEEVDDKVQSSDEDEEEMSLEENSDSDFDKDSSGSEYGKKAKKAPKMKKETPSRLQPKRASGGTTGNKRGRKPGSSCSATNGSSSKKLKLDQDVIDKKEKDKKVEDKRSGSEEDDDDEESPMKIDEDKVDTASSADDEEPQPAPKATEAKKNDKEKVKEKVEEKKDKKEPVEKSDEEEEDEASEDDAGSEEEEKPKEKEKETTALKNRTDTDLTKITFTCDKKTPSGEAWNFKIACWNVGGVKSWVKKSGLDYVGAENPDILCLQEIRCTEKTKPPEIEKLSKEYPHVYWSFSEQAGHHGVATFSKTKPISESYGLPIEDGDSDADKKLKEMFNKEGRLIVTEFEKFYLLNAYVPNSGRGVSEKPGTKPYPPRITNGERPGWDRLFSQYVKKLDETKPVIVTGDLNVAHEEIDLANPKTNTSTAGFTKEEREAFTGFLKDAGLIDSFRSLYPDAKGAYTFWSFMHNARGKNIGWRLDYFLLSQKLKENLCETVIRSDVYGSDHCPIVLFTHI